MRPRRGRRNAAIAAAPCLVAVLVAASAAHGQSATPLERFQPAPIGDALFASPSADVDAHRAFDAGLVFSYANAPLILRNTDAKTGEPIGDAGALVGHQAVLHVMLSASLFSRVKLDVDLPMTVDQSGDSPTIHGVKLRSPAGFAINDLRVGLRVAALEASGYVPGAALSFTAWMPTGDAQAYASSGAVRFEPRIIVGADYGPVLWSASVGRQFGDPNAGLLGSEVTFAGGIAARIDRFQIGPEVMGSVVVDRPASSGGIQGSDVTLSQRTGGGLEALLGAKAKLGPLTLGLAGGLGFLRGVGAPDYRIVSEVVFRPFEEKKRPEPVAPLGGTSAANGTNAGANGGANAGQANVKPAPSVPVAPVAPLDSDGDTVIDKDDACPKIVGDPRPEASKRGCPPDRDGDGIYDVEDSCPDRPGVSADGDKNGCPPDSDGDGLVDPDDACPKEAGAKTADPKTTGCPISVRVEGTQIIILQQVNFETAKAQILPVSFSLLQQVADVLAQHPDIARLAVDGHTDDRGTEVSNLELSRARAVSVMKWLTAKGIDPRRLEARGFGPRQPVADNKSPEGRAKNRRVEFQIRKRTDKGEAGWIDGAIGE